VYIVKNESCSRGEIESCSRGKCSREKYSRQKSNFVHISNAHNSIPVIKTDL
jgi:hypothetical protein